MCEKIENILTKNFARREKIVILHRFMQLCQGAQPESPSWDTLGLGQKSICIIHSFINYLLTH